VSKNNESLLRARLGLLSGGASLLALCVVAASPASAQTQPATSEDDGAQPVSTSTENTTSVPGEENIDTAATPSGEIVVTGIRRSLQNAQNIKRRADTVVDAITAEDIGALPDRSVTEALQRVPGVSINRFAGSNDPDHYSGEGSGVVVRGLTYVRSEFNGRDTFSPGVGGQAINFQDVPADMLGSVQVWKNSTAEMVEGGLSGTVNMNLRLPFDNRGTDFNLGFSAEAVRTDMRKKWSPVVSVVASKNWETDAGRFGLLGAFSYSKLFSRSDGVRISNFQTRDGNYAIQSNSTTVLTCRNPLPSNSDATGQPPTMTPGTSGTPEGNGTPCYGPATGGPDGFADFASLLYAPNGGQFVTQEFDRTRKGFAAAAQWESIDRRATVTAQFLRSHATQNWGEYTFEAGGDLAEYNTYPVGCRPNNTGPAAFDTTTGATTGDPFPRAVCPVGQFENYQYDENGVFESGYVTLPVGGWRGNIGYVGDRVPAGGIQHALNRRQVKQDNIVNDFGLNAKFTPNDRWAFNADVQHVRATTENLDFGIHGSIFADQEIDLTGQYPQITPHKPGQLGLWATWSQNSAVTPELAGASDAEYFSNPRYTFWRSAMDHIEDSSGREWAFRGDAQYNFLDDVPFLRHAKFGARYADRDQTVRYTTYNWGSLSEVWTGRAVHMDELGGSNVEQHTWDNFFRGEANAPPVANYYAGDLVGNYQQAIDFATSVQNYSDTVGGGGANSWVPLAARPNAITGTPFLPADIQPVSQEDKALYAMLSFGQDDPVFGNVTVDGNVGVRYVNTRVRSVGSIGAPSQQQLGVQAPFFDTVGPDGTLIEGRCEPSIPEPPAPPILQIPGGVCLLGPEGYAQVQAFATGETFADEARQKYDYFLPSLNIKFGLARDLILRLAAGKNLARANMQDIRNFLTVGAGGGDDFRLTATAGNPYLKPAISTNLDASLEWYFGGSGLGSLTFNLFAKNIDNFFYQSIVTRDITSNGITFPIDVRGPANYDKTGKIRGFELAYQQSYDFLPGVLSGLGLSANYSHIKSSGLQAAQLAADGVDQPTRSPIGTPVDLPLEQLSKHNVNIQPFYEKGPISLRVAYNWRSKFLLTAQDVIFPYFPIFNDKTGRVDATFFYKVNDNIKLGVQGVNLTNEVTKTLQQFTTSGLLGPRSFFMEDRRFHFIVRGNW
jgi:TonB-dependent receptor